MTRDEILRSKKLKEQFIKDNNLPITVTDGIHFLQRLNLLNQIFHCNEAFKNYCVDLRKYDSEEQYFRERGYSLDACVLRLSGGNHLSAIQRFLNANFSELLGEAELLSCGAPEDFYTRNSCGHTYARIKFKHGAFSAINYFDKSIFQADSPKAFLRTYDKHLTTSKEFHDAILAAFGEARISQLVTVYLSLVAHYLSGFFWCKPEPYIQDGLLYELPDDVLFSDTDIANYKKQIDSALTALPDGLGECFECEIFRLEELESYGFMEEYHDEIPVPVRFIGVDPNYYHLLATYYFRQPLLYDYLVINYDGHLAKLIEPIKSPF